MTGAEAVEITNAQAVEITNVVDLDSCPDATPPRNCRCSTPSRPDFTPRSSQTKPQLMWLRSNFNSDCGCRENAIGDTSTHQLAIPWRGGILGVS